MRKVRDYDAELNALRDKAKAIKARKVEQLGALHPKERTAGISHLDPLVERNHQLDRRSARDDEFRL